MKRWCSLGRINNHCPASVAIHDGVSYHEHDMLTKEELDEIKRAWGDGNPKSVVCLLLSHIDEQEAELNGRQATLDVLDAEITSLRETVRFLNDAVRVLEAKLWGKP